MAGWFRPLSLKSQTQQRTELISKIPAIALDKSIRSGLFTRRGSNCIARSGAAAEGTPWSKHGANIDGRP